MDEATRRKIENRAYELYVKRNGVHGYHIEDWLKAEQEIMGNTGQAAAASAPGKKPMPRKRKKD